MSSVSLACAHLTFIDMWGACKYPVPVYKNDGGRFTGNPMAPTSEQFYESDEVEEILDASPSEGELVASELGVCTFPPHA